MTRKVGAVERARSRGGEGRRAEKKSATKGERERGRKMNERQKATGGGGQTEGEERRTINVRTTTPTWWLVVVQLARRIVADKIHIATPPKFAFSPKMMAKRYLFSALGTCPHKCKKKTNNYCTITQEKHVTSYSPIWQFFADAKRKKMFGMSILNLFYEQTFEFIGKLRSFAPFKEQKTHP